MSAKHKPALILAAIVLTILVTTRIAVAQERVTILCRDGTDCVVMWNGGSIKWFSDEGGTQLGAIGGANGASWFQGASGNGTATPLVMIQNGSNANSFEIRNTDATPVFYVDKDGNATYNGFSSGGGVVNAPAKINAATAIATATPAFVVDSLGVSVLFEVRDAATPVAVIANGGATSLGNDGAGADLTLYGATATNELLWDASANAVLLDGVDSATAFNVTDGNAIVNDNLTVTAGNLTVTAGNATVGGTLGVTGATTHADDVTVSAATGGNNAGARNQFIGLPRIKLVGMGQGTNPGSQTVACMDATPAGEWAKADAGTNLVVSADTSYYRDVTNSIKLLFTDVVDNDGVVGTIAETDLTDMESLGAWVYSTVAISSGDFDVTLDDTNGTDQVYTVGAVAANTWTWIELDISGCNGNCDSTTGIKFLSTSQGGTALTAASVYLDAVYVWDAADEDALGVAIQRDGVLSIVNTESGAELAEWTDYIVHEEATVDFVVWVTDQSTADVVALVAY